MRARSTDEIMAMMIKPKRGRAFLKTFVFYFVLISIITFVAPFQSESAGKVDFSFAVLGGVLFGLLVAFLFSPREIAWDDDGFRIRGIFSGSVEYDWSQLEAYSHLGRGPFSVKFEGKQAFRIYSAGFSSAEWKTFQQFLKERFPEKKAWVWAGPLPLRFGNRKI
jgi:hypothetical protein